MIEYTYDNSANVSIKIFELGLKDKFGEDVDYVVRYLEFLIGINDDKSMLSFSLFSD